VAITNADANLLNLVNAKKKIVLSYSLQPIEKFIRKKQLFAYIKHRPKIFLLGNYHKKKGQFYFLYSVVKSIPLELIIYL